MKHLRKLSGILAIMGSLGMFVILQAMMQLPESLVETPVANLLPPMIALEPETLTTVQMPDSLISQTLAIHNLGDEALNWHVYMGVIPLWDQTDNMSPNNAAPSQYFPDPKLQAGGYAADDFVVPSGQTWQVEQLLIPGVYADNDEKAFNFDVNVYTDAVGMPGTLVVSATVFPTSDISGEITLDLVPPLSVSAGTYWLSVNANALFGASQTQWFWRTRTIQTGSPYHWMETAGLFGTDCDMGMWEPGASVCGVGGGVDPDLSFRLGYYIETNCDSLSDLPWLKVNPALGSVGASNTVNITVGFDATGYGPGLYTGNLCFTSNDPAQILAAVPVTMTVALEHGVALTADSTAFGPPGGDVHYTLWLTNTGFLADTYTLAVNGQWTTTLSTNNQALDGLAVAPIMVTVTIPPSALEGDMDTAVITATSQANPTLSASVTLTTTVVIFDNFVYLPYIRD